MAATEKSETGSESERPKQRFRSCLDLEVLRTRLLDAPFPQNTSQDVGPSSLETLRQRLNSDSDIKRLDGIAVRCRHTTLYLPECSLRSGRLFTSLVCLSALLEYILVQTVPQTLRRANRRRDFRSSAQPSAGPARSRPGWPRPFGEGFCIEADH